MIEKTNLNQSQDFQKYLSSIHLFKWILIFDDLSTSSTQIYNFNFLKGESLENKSNSLDYDYVHEDWTSNLYGTSLNVCYFDEEPFSYFQNGSIIGYEGKLIKFFTKEMNAKFNIVHANRLESIDLIKSGRAVMSINQHFLYAKNGLNNGLTSLDSYEMKKICVIVLKTELSYTKPTGPTTFIFLGVLFLIGVIWYLVFIKTDNPRSVCDIFLFLCQISVVHSIHSKFRNRFEKFIVVSVSFLTIIVTTVLQTNMMGNSYFKNLNPFMKIISELNQSELEIHVTPQNFEILKIIYSKDLNFLNKFIPTEFSIVDVIKTSKYDAIASDQTGFFNFASAGSTYYLIDECLTYSPASFILADYFGFKETMNNQLHKITENGLNKFWLRNYKNQKVINDLNNRERKKLPFYRTEFMIVRDFFTCYMYLIVINLIVFAIEMWVGRKKIKKINFKKFKRNVYTV